MFREAELHEIRMRDATKTRPDVATSGRDDQGRGGNTHLRTGLADSARELGINRLSLSDSVRFAQMDPKIVEEAVKAGVDGRPGPARVLGSRGGERQEPHQIFAQRWALGLARVRLSRGIFLYSTFAPTHNRALKSAGGFVLDVGRFDPCHN
ncbi:hypothetical protein [Methylocystis sp.]|uniref:hypothetical protein n=1 Tax=Methylocystis sp. TaxID=1911079 RepID=UPI003DA67D88